jgi:hypothetical protein
MNEKIIILALQKVGKPLARAYWRWRYRLAKRRVQESGQADHLDNGKGES